MSGLYGEEIEGLCLPLARVVEVHDALASTQERARELALAGTPHGTLVVTEVQTGGRGRLGRHWGSPQGGLWMSLVLRPGLEAGLASRITKTAAVGVAGALWETGVEARIKWPNDLLVGDESAKAGGILAQSHGEALVLGIGVNVSTTRAELPVPEATSLELAGGTPVDRSRLLGAILGHFGERYSDWLSVGGDAAESFLSADYRARCATLNRPVVVTPVVGSPYRGLATDIDDQGRLLVLREAGGLQAIAAADVRHLREPTD